jgi:para-nitrobenzyl esterase
MRFAQVTGALATPCRRAAWAFAATAAAIAAMAAPTQHTWAADSGPGFAVRTRTAQGEVTGQLSSGIATFLGIPYAAPPVGNLRLAPPQPHASWSGVLQAT